MLGTGPVRDSLDSFLAHPSAHPHILHLDCRRSLAARLQQFYQAWIELTPVGHSARLRWFQTLGFVFTMNKSAAGSEVVLKKRQKKQGWVRREGPTRVKKVYCWSSSQTVPSVTAEASVLQCDPKCEIQVSRNVWEQQVLVYCVRVRPAASCPMTRQRTERQPPPGGGPRPIQGAVNEGSVR